MFRIKSILFYVIYGAARLPISHVMFVRIYVFYLIIIIKSEVRTIGHYLGLGHETAVCVVCPAIFPGIVYTLPEKRMIWLKHGFRCQHFQFNLYKDDLTPNTIFCMCNKELWLWWSRQWCIGNNNSNDYKMVSFDTFYKNELMNNAYMYHTK